MASKVPGSAAKRPPGGSRKGKPNKVTAELKDMILQALDEAGGVTYLLERARDPKTSAAFMSLVGKTLPMTVKGPGEGGEFFQKIVVEVVKAK